ncbi:MAG: ABC transporter ATP-binding protein [Acidimicrobiales bacterium]
MAAAARLAWACGGPLLVVRVALAVAAGAAPVAVAWLTREVLDRLVGGSGPVLAPTLLLVGAAAAVVLVPHLIRYVDEELQRQIGLGARQRMYAAVGRMAGLRRFEDPQYHDRLALAAESGPNAPMEVVSGTLAVGQSAVGLLGFLATMLLLNPWMLVIIVVSALPALHAEMRLVRRRTQVVAQLSHAWRREDFYAQLLRSSTAAKEVRLFGLGSLFGARMVAELRQINRAHRQLARRELVVQLLLGLFGALVAAGGLVWAVQAAQAGDLTVGDVSIFVASVAGIQDGLSLAIASLGRVREAMFLFGHYRAVVDSEPDLPVLTTSSSVPRLQRGVELRDVWFRYGDDLPWVLRGVSLTLPHGSTTALVGRNGSGKSTIVKLLCRFYDPTRGAVLWDGVDLRELPVDELRRRIGAVFQDFVAYELSAADNIGLGDLRAGGDRGRIEAAAHRAGCDETLVALPHGYDTMLTRIYAGADDGEDAPSGVVLSGGQWQRVAVARALMRDDCDLLILDEPSTGLDAEAEYDLHRRLRRHRTGRTSLLISHRLNTVRDADSIVVVADGTVAEQGAHVDLIDAAGTYARLFERQSAGYGS